MNRLDSIFKAKTVAVIGASNKKGSVGHALIKNLVGSGYDGIVYPVNPKRTSILGVKCYQSIKDITEKIDLAIIATPAATVPKIVEECGKAGVGGLVIISAGFKEVGEDELCSNILATAKRYDMPIIGPNCLGFIRPSTQLNASFAKKMALPGKIAFISQSGALGTAILDWSIDQNVGFSHFVSIGSMLDIGFHDLIDYFGQDPETNSILIYMESLSDARKFLSAARAFARSKPIIVLKVGRSSEGAKAAMSHTGSLAGNDAVYNAAFERAGIIRVNTIGELFDSAQTLAMQKRPLGNKLAIVTNAGGPGVIATDYLISKGGKLAELSKETIAELNKVMPAAWSHGNPVDVLGDADPERYEKAIQICMNDKGIDGILVILTPQEMTDSKAVAKSLVDVNKHDTKTLLASWMGEEDVQEGRNILKNGNVPVYRIPENAIRSFMNMYNYSKNLKLLYETPATIPHAFTPKTEANRALIDRVVKEKRYVMTEIEAKEFLSNYDIPVTKSGVAKSPKEAMDISSKIGFPVAMKIMSPDILHKTDVGGVKLNIISKEEAKKAYSDILASAKKYSQKADIEGVFIEQMISKKYELIIGSKKDPIFGPAIVFGMGGVAVEIFKDTNVGLPPLNMNLSMLLIEETKIFKLLKGYRGMPGVDIESIQFLLYKFAYLLSDFPEIQDVDINPFAVDEHGGIVLDAKVILDKSVIGKKLKPYSHMVILPYPKEYVTDFTMKNGKNAIIRPIKPEDEPMEAEMFSKFSEQTERFRFFTLIKDVTHELLMRYTQIDYDREIALIAEVEEKGKKKMAGVVRLIADPYNDTGEFAIVVADPWQNLGIGNKFTDYILDIAKQRGIKGVYADFLKDNYLMKNMFSKRGFTITLDDNLYHAELRLQ
ncbi:MAG: bifunctional acetate--CoA ligase family protein/GNAT family N-acetyltransferase [Nanoarchaeota archaeon]|nr:bifunctional acetate--CoA ligase family protein/GNAT family N-acetyltransferase [Nanoarchaeota archaeon]MBU1704335.1 bifunctional acetate--CoA ligase family protein/GNAT family N-acetyltransferase [Nanoarchaeota archaeon]